MKILSIFMFVFALALLPATSEARAHNKHARKPASTHHAKKKHVKTAKGHSHSKPKRVGTRYH